MMTSSPFFPKVTAIEPGAIVGGKYRVERVLGAGGFGVVFVARHIDLGHRVAIKTLHASFAADPVVLARFRNEARAAATIQSEHVVRVFDVSAAGEPTPYMVMDYLEGEDLADRLRREGPMRVEDAVRYVVEACAGVAVAHQVGVIHRDLKPSNLFLAQRSDGTSIVKVLDFGISKRAIPSERPLTEKGSLHGTPEYMAPEQLRGDAPIDGRVDVWALGVILYELLTSRRPWAASSIPSLIARILTVAPTPPRELRGAISPELEAIVQRCLEKDRDRRYATVIEVADDLARVCPARAEAAVVGMRAALENARRHTSLLPLPRSRSIERDVLHTALAHVRNAPDASARAMRLVRPRRHRLLVTALGLVLGVAGGAVVAMGTAQPRLRAPAPRLAARVAFVTPSPAAVPSISAPAPVELAAAPAPASSSAKPAVRAAKQAPSVSARTDADDLEFGGRK